MTDSTGAIEGWVTTDDLQPIKNAQVAIQAGDHDPVMTDAEGHFQFSNVEPGRHVVFVNALGYKSVGQAIEVLVGELAQSTIQLDVISTTEAFSTFEVKKGYIACGTGTGAKDVGGFTQVSCGDNDPNQAYLFEYNFAKGLQGILLEMVWKPGQGLSKDLVLNVEKDGCGFTCGADDTFAQVQGCCMIRVALPVESLSKASGELPATDFTSRGGAIQTRTFPAFGEDGSPTTVITGQGFDIYVTYFYNELPSDFETRSHLPDS